MFGGLSVSLPTFEPADPDTASVKTRHLHSWDVKRILTDVSNEVVTVGDFGFRRLSDFEALETHFGLPKDARGKLLDTREMKDVKGLQEQYITLLPSQMVIVVYQRFPSTVFAEPEYPHDRKPLTIEDFFRFVVYEVHKECLPVWGRALIHSARIINAIQLHNDWYAVWTRETKGYGYRDLWYGDDRSYTTDMIHFINRNGTVETVYQDSYDTWDELGIDKIRLSRSGKSIVVSPVSYDKVFEEVVIPLPKSLV